MAIPESTLSVWSGQGAVKTAQAAHEAVRSALSEYSWPEGVKYDVYLQGSYANSTNVRGSSDVDVVVELTSTFYSNLTDSEKQRLEIRPATYSWSDFRKDVLQALVSHYPVTGVDGSGDKCIHVPGSTSRQPADVLACASFQRYSDLRVEAEGVTFWTERSGSQIVNYPRLHADHGASKNSDTRTSGRFKPAVRMFKSARDELSSGVAFPSYFLECLVYNAPDNEFGRSWCETFVHCLNYWNRMAGEARLDEFVCQNHQWRLFGDLNVQWSKHDGLALLAALTDLWKGW